MSLCVISDPATKNLVLSTAVPCDGYLLLAETDIKDQITFKTVSMLFGAACALYALTYVIRMALIQLGFKG